MEVILLEDVENLGKIGDLVKVADGYARNFLIPKNKALVATKRNIKELEHAKRLAQSKKKQELKTAEDMVTRLETLRITIPAKVGEEDKLFGSVTTRNIAEALEKEGIEIERRKILLEEPIKTTGVFDVPVRIHAELIGKLRVWVVAE